MKRFPIKDSVAGEQLLAVSPPLAREPNADWRQRLVYFSGRALTEHAFRVEQNGRLGHVATLGQAFSPGVVTGLEVSAAQTGEGVVLEIAAGMGLATSGEIVTLNRNHQLRLDDIQVFAPAALLGPSADAEADEGAGRLGESLAELRAAGRPLPEAMILVLQPVSVEVFSEEATSDPCEADASAEPFENWQWIDGCRLLLYAWPAWLGAVPVAGAWRRNRMAHAIFEAERLLGEGEYPPWCALGVPVALIGLDETLRFTFIDRNAVVRRGGEAKGGDVPISTAGNRFLWQARFEQFNEQLVDWLANDANFDAATIKAESEFRHLPPVGVLPAGCMSPRQQMQHFFPVSFAVRALALPYEQLDLALEESAGLLGYDLNTPDQVEVLVPVPQAHFDPQLLVVETIDAEFDRTIQRFRLVRDQWLGRRLVLRHQASALFQAIKGRPLLYPLLEIAAFDGLEQPTAFTQALVQAGDKCRYLKGSSTPAANWMQIGCDETGWSSGTTPIGYGMEGLGTVVEDMAGHYRSLFLRHPFHVSTLLEGHRFTLVVTTSGGCSVWLNGRLLRSDEVKQSSTTLVTETRRYELGELAGWLIEGENLLAIEARSSALNAASFTLSVDLLDTEEQFGTREVLVNGKKPPFGREQYEVEALGALKHHLDVATPLSAAEIATLDDIGIEAYIDFLQRKIDQADDCVEFGFLRLRTDIYRVRQMMVGNEVGTKLATSPALAEIAKSESAVAAKQELSDFYTRIKQSATSEIAVDKATEAPIKATASMRNNLFVSGELLSGVSEKLTVKDGLKIASLESDTINLRSGQSSSDLYKRATSTATEIGEQNPVVGKMQSFNSATVGERLEESSANIAHMAGVAAKGEVIGNLLATDMALDDLSIPGVSANGKNYTFADIRADGSILGRILGGEFDPVGTRTGSGTYVGDDEASYFNAGVKALEGVVGLLRLVEGRIQAYRRAVERCKSTIAELQGHLSRIDSRLQTVANELAEARHDVSVARSLKAEEEARINALNTKRDQVLDTLVPFVLFRRPRTTDPRQDAPLHGLNPDLSTQPLPLCDLSEVEAPDALEAMLDVIREAPLAWFVAVHRILPLLSRLEDLHITLAGAKKRATTRVSVHPFFSTSVDESDKLQQGLGSTLNISQQRIQGERRKTQAIDLAAFQRLGWQESILRVPEVVSLGDLIDASHGRMGASQRAAQELAQITEVATCLYLRFSAVPAGIRLDWAEQLSQYDAPVNLRNLYSLPRFGELDYIERNAMQRLVDWLYGRILSTSREAQEMMSDLIRVALLCASHAPVNRLIAGYLPAAVTVIPGLRLPVIVDLSRVRVGMAVSLGKAGTTLVRGQVVDIAGGQVFAEVHTVVGESVQLEANTKVQIGERLGLLG